MSTASLRGGQEDAGDDNRRSDQKTDAVKSREGHEQDGKKSGDDEEIAEEEVSWALRSIL